MNVVAGARALNEKSARQKWEQFCDPTLAFSDSFHNGLLDTWRAKAGSRTMPKRSDMTPRDLKDILRNIVLVERLGENPSSYMFRLIGTGLTQVVGHVTARTFEECVPPDHLSRWVESCDLVLQGAPLRFLGRVRLNGHEYLNAEHLYVPLANEDDRPTYIMGLCRYTPRRFDEAVTDSFAFPGSEPCLQAIANARA